MARRTKGKPWTREKMYASHLAGHVFASWATGLTAGRFEGKPMTMGGLFSSKDGCVVAAQAWARAARGGPHALQYAMVAMAGRRRDSQGAPDTTHHTWGWTCRAA